MQASTCADVRPSICCNCFTGYCWMVRHLDLHTADNCCVIALSYYTRYWTLRQRYASHLFNADLFDDLLFCSNIGHAAGGRSVQYNERECMCFRERESYCSMYKVYTLCLKWLYKSLIYLLLSYLKYIFNHWFKFQIIPPLATSYIHFQLKYTVWNQLVDTNYL